MRRGGDDGAVPVAERHKHLKSIDRYRRNHVCTGTEIVVRTTVLVTDLSECVLGLVLV